MVQDLLNATVLGSIYLLFAMGMSLTWGTIGILNMAHGAIFMFSAFTAFAISTVVSLPSILYVVIAVITGAAISTIAHLLVFQPIQGRAKTPMAAEFQILIAGIGFGAIPVAITQNITKNDSFGYDVLSETIVFNLFGVRFTSTMLMIIVSAAVLTTAIAIWLRRSKSGLALRAIGVDRETASLMGVNEARLGLITMAVAGGLAGLAGAMLTIHLASISPNSGDGFLIKGFAAIVLGGVGSIAGVLIGSMVLAFAETFVVLAGYGSWANAVSFALIVVVLLVRPQGILGRKEVRRT